MLLEKSLSFEGFKIRENLIFGNDVSDRSSTRCGRAWQCICPGEFRRSLSNNLKIALGTTLTAVGVGCAVAFSCDYADMEEDKAILAGVISGVASGIISSIALKMRSRRMGEGVLGHSDESFCTELKQAICCKSTQRPLLRFEYDYPVAVGDDRFVL